jgi:hypothetical protein
VYSALYKRVIGSLEYGISNKDQETINQEQTAQAVLTETIINLYRSSGLDDEPQKYPSIMHIMKRIKEVSFTLTADSFCGSESSLHFESEVDVKSVPFSWFFKLKFVKNITIVCLDELTFTMLSFYRMPYPCRSMHGYGIFC